MIQQDSIDVNANIEVCVYNNLYEYSNWQTIQKQLCYYSIANGSLMSADDQCIGSMPESNISSTL